MSVLTQSQIDNLKTTLIARWNAGLALSKEDWKLIAKLVISKGRSNTYAWLTQFPAFREWVGSRLHKKIAERAYQVTNRKFEVTVDITVDDIDDVMTTVRRTGMIPLKIEDYNPSTTVHLAAAKLLGIM